MRAFEHRLEVILIPLHSMPLSATRQGLIRSIQTELNRSPEA